MESGSDVSGHMGLETQNVRARLENCMFARCRTGSVWKDPDIFIYVENYIIISAGAGPQDIHPAAMGQRTPGI